MPNVIPIALFLNAPGPIFDVRSPSEFTQGHIPEAVSFPLFSDDERAQVGTCYKQQGRDLAVELGFELAGPKQADFLRRAKAIAAGSPIRLHCWRGGMRSESMAWLLRMGGLQVTTLEGGYKAFRRWVRTTVAQPKPIMLLGGMTGTGKTDILIALRELGEQVLDLEALANHRGSSFGSLGLPPQPSTEHFENLVALAWHSLSQTQPIWIEAESKRIGTCRIPPELFGQMAVASTLAITRSLPERLDLLVNIYGQSDTVALVEATQRIRKRLGGERTQNAIALIEQGNLRDAIAIVLNYYDRAYRYDLARRNQTIPEVDISGLACLEAAQLLSEKASCLHNSDYSRHLLTKKA